MQTEEIRDRLDQALAKFEGVKLDFADPGAAHRFRLSVYALRRRDRKNGTSPYDALVLSIAGATVRITQRAPLPAAQPLDQAQ